MVGTKADLMDVQMAESWAQSLAGTKVGTTAVLKADWLVRHWGVKWAEQRAQSLVVMMAVTKEDLKVALRDQSLAQLMVERLAENLVALRARLLAELMVESWVELKVELKVLRMV